MITNVLARNSTGGARLSNYIFTRLFQRTCAYILTVTADNGNATLDNRATNFHYALLAPCRQILHCVLSRVGHNDLSACEHT